MSRTMKQHCHFRCRPAFTLVELLVSLGVLGVALTVVGVVFTVTTRTASQASAVSEVERWLRQFEHQLREDLRGIDTTRSMLVLVGRTQAAARTPEDLEAQRFHRFRVGAVNPDDDPTTDSGTNGVPPDGWANPRADLMMFFTEAESTKQIVYGHASVATDPLADYDDWEKVRHVSLRFGRPNASGIVQNQTHAQQLSALPLQDWRLARRAVTLLFDETPLSPENYADDFADAIGVRLVRNLPVDSLSNPRVTDADEPGDGAVLDLDYILRQRFLPADSNDEDAAALANPYAFDDPGSDSPDAQWDQGPGNRTDIVNQLMYPTDNGSVNDNEVRLRYVALVSDQPPLDPEDLDSSYDQLPIGFFRSNLALQALPGCVWFQIEFLMPEDPRNSGRYIGQSFDPSFTGEPDDENDLDYAQHWELPRWVEIEPGETYVFVPDTSSNRNVITRVARDEGRQPQSDGVLLAGSRFFARLDQNGVAEHVFSNLNDPGSDLEEYEQVVRDNFNVRMWPYGLRITAKAIDPQGRLEAPLTRTIIHRFD